MNKKKIIIISGAVAAFVIGAIFSVIYPATAAAFALFETAIGFVCGYFFAKECANEALAKYKLELDDLRAAQKAFNEPKKIRISTKKVDASKNTQATPVESKKNSNK